MNKSTALFPVNDEKGTLEKAYVSQCTELCWADYPSFAEVLMQMESIREYI